MPDRNNSNDPGDSSKNALAAAGSYAGLGLQLAASIGLFLWLGWKADQWIGTTPLLTITGAFVGAGGGFYSLYRHLILESRDGNGPTR
jgi:ATP synthase protein I